MAETETDFAVNLANKVLDRPNGDPDDDIAILARQFLRAREPVIFSFNGADGTEYQCTVNGPAYIHVAQIVKLKRRGEATEAKDG